MCAMRVATLCSVLGWASTLILLTYIFILDGLYNTSKNHIDRHHRAEIQSLRDNRLVSNLHPTTRQSIQQVLTTTDEPSFDRSREDEQAHKAPPSLLDTSLQASSAASNSSFEARILVLVMTGGSKEKTVRNRQAVLDTWGSDPDVFYVTRDAINTTRVIRLPPEQEATSYSSLPRKVLNAFEHVAQSDMIDKYDFVMKADDDIYVNLPLLRQQLALIDPDRLFFGGDKVQAQALQSAWH
eukprot:TRINITY_DN11492_c6_g6_i1.p1 TRINITY_DN11492_c6_g6~~TRINITY_DN11492_c6_g6_i1.p1  ORF type:complete len:240 (+),score=50.46 TRINITY_DN11492_c6_g6_i1:146-865(+)